MTNRTRCCLAVCCLISVTLTGCSLFSESTKERLNDRWLMLIYPHAKNSTLTMSGEEHFQWVKEVSRRDKQALQDDLDLLFMTDRPSRLTRWHDR